MSEEEIIKILEDYTTDLFHSYNEKIIMKAIQGLLDLYKQEKEKNKKLEKENKNLKQDISEMYYKGVVLDILQDQLNISRDEAQEILENS